MRALSRVPAWTAARLGAMACAACVACAGCASAPPVTLPWEPSPKRTASGHLRAGFGRVDITPPPGVPLSGSSFESRQSFGWAQRIHARALVLEDRHGERVALVSVELPLGSMLLHRHVAAALRESGSSIGADRLLISMTHTHAGPGSYYDAEMFNDLSSARPGYDARATAFYVGGIARAVRAAEDSLLPARVAWGRLPTLGLTRNRSLRAFLQNDPLLTPIGPEDAPLEQRATDRDLYMLRVDRCDPARSACVPAGAYSVFAVHGTTLPSANDLVDSDIQGVAARYLERAIDAANLDGGASPAVHVLVNGTEGDVSPNVSEATRCGGILSLRVGRRPSGPKTPAGAESWHTDERERARCLAIARLEMVHRGTELGAAAAELFDRLEARLTDTLTIARAFTTLRLTDPSSGLCPEARNGSSNFAGAWDAVTRIRGWRFLWLVDPHFVEDGAAIDRASGGCHRPKRVIFEKLQPLISGHRPDHAQIAVVRIGSMLVGALPAEITTEAGMRMKAAMRRAFGGNADAVIVGLTNGYIQYIATAEEYGRQHYAGGSTMYGPGSAAALQRSLARLAASLRYGHPLVEGSAVVTTLGRTAAYFRPPDAGPSPERIRRRITSQACTNSVLIARWIDAHPGRIVPADRHVLRIDRRAGAAWVPVTRDDDPFVEVRALRAARGAGFEWEVRWHQPILGAEYRLVVLAGKARPELTAPGFTRCE